MNQSYRAFLESLSEQQAGLFVNYLDTTPGHQIYEDAAKIIHAKFPNIYFDHIDP